MILYHTTPRRNLPSIYRNGLRMNRGVIWLHDKKATAWAVKHLAKHHKVGAFRMVTFPVRVDPGVVVKAGGKPSGKYLCFSDIPPECIV